MRLLSPCLKAQIVKELLSVLRDPKSRLVLVMPPLLQLFIFAFAVTLEVRNIPLGIYDRDGGRWSQELVARIGAAAFVGEIHSVSSSEALRALIDRKAIIAGIDIPESFSRDLAAGRTATAQVILDGRSANASQVTLGYLNQIARGLDADLAADTLDAEPVAVRHWFNPNLIYRWFVVPSLSGILAMFSALLVTSLSIARERELGTFDQLLVSPTTAREIIVAKTVPALIIGSVLGLMMVAAGVFAFGVPFTGSFFFLFASLLLFMLSVVGIGLMISSISATQQQAILGTFALGVPMVLMSGFATPVDNMPEVLQWIAEGIPLTHFLIIAQGSFVKALPFADIFAHVWPMAATALVTLVAAGIIVRARLD
jgi:ABC-2 type transport system permease protein